MKAYALILLAALLCGSALAQSFPDVEVSNYAPAEYPIDYSARLTTRNVREILKAYAGQSDHAKHAGAAARWIARDVELSKTIIEGFRQRAAATEDKQESATFRWAAEAMERQARETALRTAEQSKIAAALALMPEPKKARPRKATSAAPAISTEPRVWTATSGKTVEASFVEKTASHVQLRRVLDDVVLTVPIESLSAEDQAFVGVRFVSFADWRRVAREKLEAKKIEMQLANSRGQAWVIKPSWMELLQAMGDSSDPKHRSAWRHTRNEDQSLVKQLADFRAEVAALVETSETKTFLARDLGPALTALATYKDNDANLTHAQIADLARLHAALSSAK